MLGLGFHLGLGLGLGSFRARVGVRKLQLIDQDEAASVRVRAYDDEMWKTVGRQPK